MSLDTKNYIIKQISHVSKNVFVEPYNFSY